MAIVGGFDMHRAQITFDCLDTEGGELMTGQIRPATRANLRRWLGERLAGRTDVAIALEGCTGWRFVVEELARAGVEPHLAEPADTATLRGRKKRPKTDRADARLLRELLHQGRLPESWIPPTHVLEVRTLGRTYVDLMDERRAWQQRIHAQLFHQGAPPAGSLLTRGGQAALDAAEVSPAGRHAIETAQAAIDGLTDQILPLRAQLRAIGNHQLGPRALQVHYGIGPLTAAIIWAELGDPRRFRSSDQAVRFAGLDVTVWSSDRRRSPGRLARQGSPQLRWALYEAAEAASRTSSPDHDYYTTVRDRLGGKRPALSVARKLVRRCHHTLRELGDAAWAPPSTPAAKAA
ncbi:MAG: IS110 family transposase [Candidatus Limnocylindria bacterium]